VFLPILRTHRHLANWHPSFFVLGAASVQIVQTLGGAFVFRAKEVDHTLVYLDARVDSALLEQLGEGSAAAGLLVESFVEEDNTGDVVVEGRVSGEQKLAISAAVFLVVLKTDISKSLSNGGSGLISGQDTFAWSHNVVGNGTELLLEGWRWVVEVGRHFLVI